MQRNLAVRAAIAPPKDRNKIRKEAFQLRKQLGLPRDAFVDIVSLLELALPVIDPSFNLLPVPDKELSGRYAETRPYEHAIYVKESVYDAAIRGGGQARMILAHELAHYLYHSPREISFAYVNRNERLDSNVDPERQADIFAAEFLAPSGELRGLSVSDFQRWLPRINCDRPAILPEGTRQKRRGGQALKLDRRPTQKFHPLQGRS